MGSKKNRKLVANHSETALKIWKITFFVIWLVIIGVLLCCTKDLSVEAILNFTPKNTKLAVGTMLLLFLLKSVSLIIYIGILYAASGIIFSLPVALAVDAFGTIIVLSIPYIIGKKVGSNSVKHIVEKYPKVQAINSKRVKSDFLFSFIVRLIGGVPTDIVSLFMGAMEINYPQYLIGGFLGLLPRMVIYSSVGMSVSDMNWPVLAAIVAVGAIIATFTLLASQKYQKET